MNASSPDDALDRFRAPEAAASPACAHETCGHAHPLFDRLGIGLSGLCAVHCAITPFLLALAPTFGRAWADERVHLGLAIVVAPLAFWAAWSGFRRHGRAFVPVLAGLGVLGIIGAFALPGCAEHASCAGCGPEHAHAGHDHAHGFWSGHSLMTTAGGFLLIAAHASNLWLTWRGRKG